MKSINLILGILFFALITVVAQDDYHTNLQAQLAEDYNLPTGEFVLFDNETATYNKAFNWGSNEQVLNSEGTTFNKKISLKVNNMGSAAWDAGWAIQNEKNIAQNDRLLLIYQIRSIGGEGRVNSFAEALPNYEKEAIFTLPITEEWTTIYIPFQATINYNAGSIQFGFHLAHQAQTIEIGGFTVINYKKTVELFNLPSEVNNDQYGGYEEDAPWRTTAAQRIAQLRKADLRIRVSKTDGTPVTDAPVEVKMLEHKFAFGTAITANRIAGNNFQNNIYENRLLNLDGEGHGFNWVVFENDLKWPAWEENWLASQPEIANATQWLVNQGMKIRGHNLVWPGLSNLPNDIQQNVNNPEYIKTRTMEHIEEIMTYPNIEGNIAEWDVLNEIVTNKSYQNIFLRIEGYETGREIYKEIFEKAKEIDPNTGLWLNDYVTITLGSTGGGQYDSLKIFLGELVDSGAPIDGIGFQGHIGGFPNGIPSVLETLDDFYNSFGLQAKITEFDLPVSVNEELAAQYLRDFMTAIFSHPSMDGFLFWSFWDGAAWRDGRNIYRLDWSRTPLGDTFVDLLFNEWWTDDTFASNENGLIEESVFKGRYEISYICDGETITQEMSITEAMNLEIMCDNLTSSTEKLKNASFKVYPNPSHDFFTIERTESTPIQIRVIDVLGRTVLKTNTISTVFTLEQKLARGTYILELFNENGMEQQKVIVE